MGMIEDVVAGLQFYDLPALRDALQQGVRLRSQRDPDNEADRNAVSLWLDRDEADRWELTPLIGGDPRRQRWMLGHLKRGMAAEIAPILDAGLALDVYVAGGSRAGAWTVNIRMEGAAADELLRRRAAVDLEDEARRQAENVRWEARAACHGIAKLLNDPSWEDAAKGLGTIYGAESYGGADRPLRTWRVQGEPPPWRTPRDPNFSRQKDLETAFGVADANARAYLYGEVDKQTPRIERLAARCRNAARKKLWAERHPQAEAAAAALEAALAALQAFRATAGRRP